MQMKKGREETTICNISEIGKDKTEFPNTNK